LTAKPISDFAYMAAFFWGILGATLGRVAQVASGPSSGQRQASEQRKSELLEKINEIQNWLESQPPSILSKFRDQFRASLRVLAESVQGSTQNRRLSAELESWIQILKEGDVGDFARAIASSSNYLPEADWERMSDLLEKAKRLTLS
jgi:hypothetical protein